ncbi:alanine--tRNA ligase [Ornithinimicrobium pekingense]|uniref:Alanine--tRNA ligase n=1 Tax=Ornithinimicrobium pekingense TaxID=384677 RepID=A0ABQ2F9A2_9MICO|nr:alanine--tRNA ligase [Ornithinimicrobium pekingense]GGK74088.1 alanine--tRNA ligase [Ornithinimicrobium pekingense]
METAEIRRRWLRFFESKGHTVVPSAPLVYDDPNLLFVNAGMVPFKPYFLGQQTAPWPRATSVQKCVRTLDIEEVGKTTRHGTFFQMNGNFSFGDYFKEGAISHAWELITGSQDDGFLGFDPGSIWVTVLDGDDEAADLWHRVAGLPQERIQRRGLADNYWHMGVPGPGGPCSEIYVDRGPEHGPDGGPVVDEDRFLEIWNLVFMQEELSEVRSKVDFDITGELPRKNIDTGMGLERVAYLLQGVDNLYEIDEVYPVIERAEELSGRSYGAGHEDDVRFRVVADHVRSGLMLMGDGVTPGNEGRGYVLRRLLRRAVRSMRLLGVHDAALPELLPVSKDVMRTSYPELERDWGRISETAYAEEEAFRRTLASGTTILDTAVARAKKAGSSSLGGDEAFQLHDTYGFPIDLTLEMASEQGLTVDEEGFRSLMTEQRQRAKADARAKRSGHGGSGAYRALADRLGGEVEFTGYEQMAGQAPLVGLLADGQEVDRLALAPEHAEDGMDVELVLRATPFYAEAGGQLADHGLIRLDSGAVVRVTDVQRPLPGLIVHRGRLVEGELAVGQAASAEIDTLRRASVSRAHTATHIVHKVLRETLGDTATQAGSENAPGRLRFDFRSTRGLSADELAAVEARINERLMDDLQVSAAEMSLTEAREMGAMALFGERYPDVVRVVSVGGPWSLELCGGTHVLNSAQLSLVKIMGEASIGSGVRRVEALVGADAYGHLARENVILNQLTDTLKVRPDEVPERVAQLMARLKDAEREIARAKAAQVLAAAGGLAERARDVAGVTFLGHDLGDGVGGDDLRRLVTDLRGRLGTDRPVVVALTGTASGRPNVVVATNEAARSRGVRAGALVKVAAQTLGGGGGGKDDLAQGGGQDPARTQDALRRIEDELRA